MNPLPYFYTLAGELESLKDRARMILDDPERPNWIADGEWKESDLRTLLRRYMPRNVEVGRGFVVSENWNTGQIDILIHSSDAPTLFRDGDLVAVTADAVVGVIEVKTNLTRATFRNALDQIAKRAKLIEESPREGRFYGIFGYSSELTSREALQLIRDRCGSEEWIPLDLVCLGASHFVRWWDRDPENLEVIADRWHSYQFGNLAMGYFIHNVVESVSPESVRRNLHVWFPKQGKEISCDDKEEPSATARAQRASRK